MSGKSFSYSSLSNVGREEKKLHYLDDDDDYVDSAWTMPEADTHSSVAHSLKGALHPCIDGMYNSSEEHPNFPLSNKLPDVNLKNVLAGIFSILTGQNKSGVNGKQVSPSNVSFFGPGNNGDTVLDSSVYLPSAPPLLEANESNYSALKDVLDQ